METIVVALDGSPRAPAVLEQALDLAKARGAALFAVRAVPTPVDFPLDLLQVGEDTLSMMLLRIEQRSLSDLVASARDRAGSGFRVEARWGTPWQVICATAKECGAALIVLGAHGYSTFERVVGTTAARVVNHAHCSVYIARELPLAPRASHLLEPEDVSTRKLRRGEWFVLDAISIVAATARRRSRETARGLSLCARREPDAAQRSERLAHSPTRSGSGRLRRGKRRWRTCAAIRRCRASAVPLASARVSDATSG